MADLWIEDLERQGLAWRLRSAPEAAVSIVSSRTVELLSPDQAAAIASRLSPGEVERAVTAAGLSGQPLLQRDLLADMSSIAEALASGKLVAFRVAGTQGISAAEAAAVEAMLNQNSVPAPPPQQSPGPAPEPLHPYPVRVLDDTNSPVSGVSMKLEIEGTPKMVTTSGAGTATAEWFSRSTGRLRILNQSQIEKQLQSRWEKPTSPLLPGGNGVYEMEAGVPFPEVAATADKETTIIISRGDDWTHSNQQTQVQCMLDAAKSGVPMVEQNQANQSPSTPAA